MLSPEPAPTSARPVRPRSAPGWRAVAAALLIVLIVVSGSWIYQDTRPGNSNSSTHSILYSGTIDSNAPATSSNCAPYQLVLGTCNATQASVLVPLPYVQNTNQSYATLSLLVNLTIIQGPSCVVGGGGPPVSYCRYILEVLSPSTPFSGSGYPPQVVNVTLYLVSQTGQWDIPASISNAWFTVRFISNSPTTTFSADLVVQLLSE